ncbi:MAG: tetratricopeptide repeat protein [Gemmatimonadota bacterium]
MKAPAPADLQRWSEEVARDATSLSFLPLARVYRRQGRRDAALRLCLRGLEHHPDHVEAHSLLAMLYFESGQRVKAYDEWSMVLTLEPDNFDALRGMGFYYLEQEDHTAAKRHLERAAVQKSHDPAVQEALRIIRERLGEVTPAPAPAPLERVDEPWASTPSTPGSQSAPAPQPAPRAPQPAPAPAPAPVADLSDPAKIFEPLLRGGQVLGALILDSQGLVMGGALSGAMGSQAEALGAILGGAIEEALRTTQHLRLGEWKGVLLEADAAVLHVAPVRDGMIVLLAAHKNAPTGWVLRSAAQAAAIATRFLEAYA